MVEYAISDGEGTLIDYGVCRNAFFDGREWFINTVWYGDYTVIIGPCDDDCQTGV